MKKLIAFMGVLISALFLSILSPNLFAQSAISNIREWLPSDFSNYSGSYTLVPNDLASIFSEEITLKYANSIFFGSISYNNEEDEQLQASLKDVAITGNTFSFITNELNKKDVKFNGKFVIFDQKINWGEGKIDIYHNLKGMMVNNKTFYIKKSNAFITASSVLIEKNKDAGFYKAENLVDHNYSTAWVEGVAGTGIGQNVTFTFYNDWQPKEFRIVNGYAKNEAIYQKNSRPKQLKLTFSDGTTQIIDLKDILSEQVFGLNISKKIGWVKIEITDVYKGTAYEDTCITEIEFD